MVVMDIETLHIVLNILNGKIIQQIKSSSPTQ